VRKNRLPSVWLRADIPFSFPTGLDVFKYLRGMFSSDLAIDLGTANLLIYMHGKGIVLNEPSVIAVRSDVSSDDRNSVAAVGFGARRMLGRAPGSLTVTRPLRDGVVANFNLTQAMLQYFIHEVHEMRLLRPSPRVLIGVPGGATQVERRAIREGAAGAGVRGVALIEEPLAAALGAGLDVSAPRGATVLDLGGGTSEVAVISLNGIVYSESIRVGGDDFDEAIIAHVRREYGTVIGEATAERIKKEIGSAYPLASIEEIAVRGGNLAEGLPRQFSVNSGEVLDCLQEHLSAITRMVHRAMESTPPELASDVAEHGLVLTGGGALLRGMDRLVMEDIGVPVVIAEDPLTCVARGAGMALEYLDKSDVEIFVPD
jgi:rod shape-determining protein MreB